MISKNMFNRRTGLAIVCPVTQTSRKLPFHVALPKDAAVTGFVMVGQVKSIDWRARRVRLIDKIPSPTLNEVLSVLDAFVF